MNILSRPTIRCHSLSFTTALLLWLALSGLSAEPALAWQSPQPLQQTLNPMRQLSLPADWNASQWARQNRLPPWQLQQGGDGRQHLSFRADEQRWQQLKQFCSPDRSANDSESPHCAPDSCQQVQNRVAAGEVQTWLVPSQPDLNSVLANRATSCPSGRVAVLLEEGADISSVLGEGGEGGGGVDPACWSLQQLQPCLSESTPAQYRQPQWRVNQLVVLLRAEAPDATGWAAAQGLQLLEQYQFQSSGERLVRLLRPASSSTALEGWIELLGASADVVSVQKELAYFTLAEPSLVDQLGSNPVMAASGPDPLRAFNYAPKLTEADRLGQRWQGREVAIALIDTGVDRSHPELSEAVVEARDFSGKGLSADAHGTAVAAIIAAARDNGVGAAGVAPAARIHSFKACHPREHQGMAAQCWSSALIKALDQAISQRIPLINMSLGGPPSPLLQRLVQRAQQRGLLVLAAAGNGGANARPVYPAAWPEALAVTAVDADSRLYRHANRGDYVQLAAPGVDIITAGPQRGQPILSGTSMATAHASAVAALLLELDPLLDGQALSQRLLNNARELGADGKDPLFGHGLINACASAGVFDGHQLLCGAGP